MKINITLILILFLLQGCSSYKIYTDSEIGKDCAQTSTCNIVTSKGIPFFVHKEITKQKTIRTRKWLNTKFELQVLEDNKIKPKLGKTFNFKVKISKDNSENLLIVAKEVVETLNESKKTDVKESIKKALNSKKMIINNMDFLCESSSQYGSPLLNNLVESLVSNTFESVVAVDYKKKYYFNTRIYPFSKNDSSITISKEGTLTNAINNVDTTELKDLIPLNEFITDKLNIEVESDPVSVTSENNIALKNTNNEDNTLDQKSKKTTYKLIVTTKIDGYKYELTQYYDDAITNVSEQPLEIGNYKHSIIRTKLNDTKVKKDEEKPKDDKSYKINGTITLPKN